jgi:hypothetical protein
VARENVLTFAGVGIPSATITDDGTVAMSHDTEVDKTKAGREVAETAALLVFMASGISAVLFFCTYAGGGLPLTGLLGAVAVAGLTGSVICLHRLGRHTTPEAGPDLAAATAT